MTYLEVAEAKIELHKIDTAMEILDNSIKALSSDNPEAISKSTMLEVVGIETGYEKLDLIANIKNIAKAVMKLIKKMFEALKTFLRKIYSYIKLLFSKHNDIVSKLDKLIKYTEDSGNTVLPVGTEFTDEVKSRLKEEIGAMCYVTGDVTFDNATTIYANKQNDLIVQNEKLLDDLSNIVKTTNADDLNSILTMLQNILNTLPDPNTIPYMIREMVYGKLGNDKTYKMILSSLTDKSVKVYVLSYPKNMLQTASNMISVDENFVKTYLLKNIDGKALSFTLEDLKNSPFKNTLGIIDNLLRPADYNTLKSYRSNMEILTKNMSKRSEVLMKSFESSERELEKFINSVNKQNPVLPVIFNHMLMKPYAELSNGASATMGAMVFTKAFDFYYQSVRLYEKV